jgi:hypothetical protein
MLEIIATGREHPPKDPYPRGLDRSTERITVAPAVQHRRDRHFLARIQLTGRQELHHAFGPTHPARCVKMEDGPGYQAPVFMPRKHVGPGAAHPFRIGSSHLVRSSGDILRAKLMATPG